MGEGRDTNRASRGGLVAAAPTVFVLLWSTGFVVAHYATHDAGPLTFLGIRTAIAAAILALIASVTRAPRPSRAEARWMALTSMGLHVVYLGGVFVAIDLGLPSGISALIAGLHPVVTSIASGPLLGERLQRRQWIGVGLGFVGVAVVVVDRLEAKGAHITGGALAAAGIAVVGMSAGSLLQRRHGGSVPLLWGAAVQYAAATVAFLTGAVLVEHWKLHVTARFAWSMAWAVLVLSMASVLLMLYLLQRQAAAKVSSLFFLTPALSTIEGAYLFHEQLGPLAWVGLAIALVGVALALRRQLELAPDEI
jgi:drug/metabolite transporter (DMT)-like permease